jgi:oxygen-independent coproporphyrinogen-3 oxidase
VPTTTSHPLLGSPYQGYVYAYPHKTAYRRLEPARPLAEVWSGERRDALFLYVHVPFCGMRCGFCNLFTQANPHDASVPVFLDALRTQAAAVRDCLGEVSFARFAVGGGTPTYLSEGQLAEVFDIAGGIMGADLGRIPTCVEVSPETLTPGKLALLRERGVTRVSIGVQSFVEDEVRDSGRPQRTRDVEEALAALRATEFPTLNIDLIYGLPGQTVATWLHSLACALTYRPEELYLYPLYVRPLTGLGRSRRAWDDVRLACYRAARDRLLAEGYEQVSMRMFRRFDAGAEAGPVYCCQDDGMVGLGCGARSYMRGLHYSTEYAVGASGVRDILRDYAARDAASFARAEHGFALDADEQRRRFLLQALLQADGLERARYARRFDSNVLDDFPELRNLVDLGLATITASHLRLTAAALERSDAVGPWLFSERVRQLMEGHEPR